MPPPALQFAKRLLLPIVVLQVAMIGLGLLVTRLLRDENAVNRLLAAHRTDPWTPISAFFSFVGSTPCIIAVTALAALVLRLTLHRWREPLFLCGAVIAQALVFFFTTLAIDRQRPAVVHLDESPPTSSFPSGHTSAAVALYCGLALLLAGLAHRPALKTLAWLLVLVPVCVAAARMYRGMHHPSDVIASFVNGLTCITVMARSLLDRTVAWAVPQRAAGASAAGNG